MSRPSASQPPPEPVVRLLLVAAPLSASPLPGALFPGVAPTVVALDALRVSVPWRGELFELLGEAAAAGRSKAAPTVGLVVPVRWLGGGPAPEVVIVSDHVNTRLRGPLTGRRPVSGPRSRGAQPFPSLTGVYQPETIVRRVRDAVERRVYSVVAVAGVAKVADLSPFERRAVAAAGCPAVCDCLIDVAIIAALHGLKVAACGVPSGHQPPTGRSS
jgi:hypothetical protein